MKTITEDSSGDNSCISVEVIDYSETSPDYNQAGILAYGQKILAATGPIPASRFVELLSGFSDETTAKSILNRIIVRGDATLIATESGEQVVPSAIRLVRAGQLLEKVGVAKLGDDVQLSELDLKQELGEPSWLELFNTGGTVGINNPLNLNDFARYVGSKNITLDDELTGWLTVAGRGDPSIFLDWPSGPTEMPNQIRRINELFRKTSSDEQQYLLNDLSYWARLPQEVRGLDPSQERVSQQEASTRIVVEAGPGSGKTHCIIARVEFLSEQSIPPTRIHILSFTRNAVAEMSGRFFERPGTPEIVLGTLDSLAAQLTTGLGEEQEWTGFEENIHQAVKLIETGDDDILDWLDARRHIIIDEAQDIVGIRRIFMDRIISSLNKNCGVTIFCDTAQAIYNYQGDHEIPISTHLCENLGFSLLRLERNHRTPPGMLRELALRGRERLTKNLKGFDELLTEDIRDLISKASSGPAPQPGVRGPSHYPDMLLFRYGHEMAAYALQLSRQGIPYTMRGGSGGARAPIIIAPAWIGAIANDIENKGELSLEFALSRLSADPLLPSVDEAKRILSPGLVNDRYDLEILSDAVSRGRLGSRSLPARTLKLSTIHAAKGQEADCVALFFPENKKNRAANSETEQSPKMQETDTSPEHNAEEARVLFVGATRARKKLLVGHATSALRRTEGRFWQRNRSSVLISIGPADAPGTVLASGMIPAELALQPTFSHKQLIWIGEQKRWALEVIHEGTSKKIALLPQKFTNDIRSISNLAFSGSAFSGRAPCWASLNVGTVSHDQSLHVVPILEGFFRLYFNNT